MSEPPSPPDWSPEAVLGRLGDEAGPDRPVSAQLFLTGDVPADQVEQRVREALAEALPKTGWVEADVRLGQAFDLARSIGIQAPVAVLKALMKRDDFVSILPSDLNEVMMKPVSKRPG